jgi:hypothetical protein
MPPTITLPDERKRLLTEAEHNANEAKILLAQIHEAFQQAKNILPANAVKAHYRNGVCKPSAYEIVADRIQALLSVPADLRVRFAAEDRLTQQDERGGAPLYRSNPNPESRTEQAVIYLLQAGKQLGCDFHLTNAVQIAHEVAEFDFIQLAKMTQKPIRFSAAVPCKDDCKGWNPRHQTCVCGHNRLHWQRAANHCFEAPNLIPVATRAILSADQKNRKEVGESGVELAFQIS